MCIRRPKQSLGQVLTATSAWNAILSLPWLVHAGCLYVLLAVLLSPQSFANAFQLNACRLLLWVVAGGLIAFLVRRIRDDPDAAFSAWTAHFFRSYGMQGLVCNVGFVFIIASFGTFKTNISSIVPFYADPYIASLDYWLHGTDPWQITHRIPDWVGLVIDVMYSQVWFAVLICSFTMATFLYEGAQLKRYMASVFLIYCLLGSVLAICFASVGPIFYDAFYPGARFPGLAAALDANQNIVHIKEISAYLLNAEKLHMANFATGISAMPSIHVAFSVAIAWNMTGRSWASAAIGWSYAAFMIFGSVYSGWHYAVDGYLSATLASLIWIGLSRYYHLPVFPQRKAKQTIEDLAQLPEHA
jgi:hypothetical protein